MIDDSKFPDVYLTLEDITSDIPYKRLITKLDNLYETNSENNQRFCLYIETLNVRSIHINYLYSFGKYLCTLKSKRKLLKHVEINVYDQNVYNILDVLFTWFASPVSPTKIFFWSGGYTDSTEERKITKTKVFQPKEEQSE